MRVATVIAVLMSLSSAAALADVYRSVDAQGHVQYSDTPTPGSELVRVTNSRNFSPTPAETPKPSSASGDAIHDKLAQDDAARSVQKDVASSRAEQCKKAQEEYDQSVHARRIYKPGKDGEREYLSDAEADQIRMNNRLAMEAACKG